VAEARVLKFEDILKEDTEKRGISAIKNNRMGSMSRARRNSMS